MKQLSPLPRHVRVPSDAEMDRVARTGEIERHFRPENCATCRGAGSFLMWAGAPLSSEVVEYECNCVDQAILDRWLAVRGIERGARRRGIFDLTGVPSSTKAWMVEWMSRGDQFLRYGLGVTLRGHPGGGKTTIATVLLRGMLASGVNGSMIYSASIGSMNGEDWRSDEVRSWWREKVRAVPLLVVDDLGKEKGIPEWIQARVEDLFYFRGANLLTTIVTTNLSLDQIRERYGSYTADTMASSCPPFEMAASESFDQLSLTRTEMDLGISRPVMLLAP